MTQPALAALILLLPSHAPAADDVGTEHVTVNASPEATTAPTVTPGQVVVLEEQAVSIPLPAPPVEDQGPPQPALTRAEAKRILSPPRGTLSHGKTNDGELVQGRRIGMRGKGYAFFDHIKERETHFGTYEMKRFLERTGHRFRKVHRWSTVGIGNVSIREGGKTRWHASHQTGRDVDIAMFGRDGRGRSVSPRNFTKYDRALKSPAGLTFDVPRNTDLVRTLMTDPEYQVQWIFVARWLRTRILANAKKRGFEPELIERMAKVMKQPGDSAPHDDHYHLRLYCSVEDRMHGCTERGPVWPWVDLGDAVFEAHVDNLERVLDTPYPKLRLAAVNRLKTIAAHSAVGSLLARLQDSHRSVRGAALDALATFRSPEAVDGLLELAAHTESTRWAGALFRTAIRSAGDRQASLARAFLEEPTAMLHATVAAGNLAGFYGVVIGALVGEADPSVVPGLIGLLSSPSEGVRERAEEALQTITSHSVELSATGSDPDEQAKAVAGWQALWDANKARTWSDWTRAGIVSAGYEMPEDLQDTECIHALIEATGDKRDHISTNAVRLLGVVTGHVIDPAARTAKRHRLYWRRWWERQQANTDGAN